MLTRWGIRLGTSLVGIAAGLLLSAAVVSSFSISASALVESTLIFWLVHLVVQVMALRVLVRQPSIALAGLLALLATIVSLVIAALIIWITTAIGDTVGSRMIRDRRQERRSN
jgi:hypothetical protein